jgi:hypothetical protein
MASRRDKSARSRWVPAAALAAALLGVAPAALADATAAEKQAARTLMDQGDEALAAKDLTAALRAYQSAHAIMNVPTTGLEVARTQAALGMLIEAHAVAEAVTRMPKVAGESPALERARQDAARIIEDLAARVPSLQLEVVGPTDPLRVEVRLDGVVVPATARAAPLPVNPGKRVLQASLAGHRDALVEVQVEERARTTVRLRLDPDPAATAAPPPQTPPLAEPPAAIASITPDAPRSSWSTQRTVALVVGGVGVVGLGVGSVFGLMAQSKNDEARTPENCPTETRCHSAGKALLDDASSAATISTIAFAAGGAALAAGVVLFVTAPSKRASAAATLRVVPGGAALRHTF